MMKPLIKLSNVSMFYHNNSTITVGISKINLEFYCGEFVAITGESGAGKTTLMNIIGSALPYHDGELYYNELPTSHFDNNDREKFRKDNIGYICQDYNLIDSYTVVENIMAALLIKGLSIKEAKDKAMVYLERVGLTPYANNKASKLSSGQKQRLGIARALAKETPIILADEPTGNLDVENGKEIVKILKELSKDHLIIMVTHNLDLVCDDVTRIIRINDGTVTYDREVKEYEKKEISIKKKEEKHLFNVAFNFAKLNNRAKPKRAILLVLFMFLISFATFIFVGNIISNLDKWKAMDYLSDAFNNGDDTRIVVERYDGNPVSSEDYETINKVKYVNEVDLYDLVNDFNYYDEEETDYKYTYYAEYLYNGAERIDSSKKEHKTPEFINDTKFLKSASCLTAEMLTSGRLPEKTNEIVVKGDESLLNTTKLVYMRGLNAWGNTTYVSYNMNIVGVIADDSESQIYISNQLAVELSMVINDQSKHNFTYYYVSGNVVRYANIKSYVFTDEINTQYVNLSHLFFDIKTEYQEKAYIDNQTAYSRAVRIQDTDLQNSKNVIVVSNSWYDYYFGDFNTYQASVYIEDYSYTDEVIASLNALGYHAASVYRLSCLEYNNDVLTEKYITIAICLVAIVIMFALTLFVLSAFLSLNQKDYLLLRLLGMNKKEMYLTNYVEIILCSVIMYVISIIVTVLLNTFKVSLVHDIIKYMSWYQFVIIFFVVLITVFITTSRFNKMLEKNYNRNGGDK